MLASQRNVFCVSCISVIAGSCIEVGSLIEPERMITHPRTIDLWQRSKKICMFSLCLIPSTYQGIIVRMSSAHCAGTFCCILTVSERKDLKVCRRKKKKMEEVGGNILGSGELLSVLRCSSRVHWVPSGKGAVKSFLFNTVCILSPQTSCRLSLKILAQYH